MMDNKWINEMLEQQEIDERLSIDTVKKVYEKLIEVARKRGHIFYEDIMQIAGLNRENKYDREIVLGRMLGGISEHEKSCSRPLLSAIVVLKKNIFDIKTGEEFIGKGFFYFNDTSMNNREFWYKEIKKVHDYWSKN